MSVPMAMPKSLLRVMVILSRHSLCLEFATSNLFNMETFNGWKQHSASHESWYKLSRTVPYFFSGVQHPALPLSDALKTLKSFVDNLGYGPFDQVLVNWYKNGNDYISAHT